MSKYVCIHGHFYQPPRENAWLDRVEQQESAKPFHDWNERINFECYAPNTVSRILDSAGKITQIRNNYKRISFNFGPTLLSWLEDNDPATYQLIKDADVRSMELFGGHGNALAQVHSHLILPLCNHRDKVTQVQWGVFDFEHRFKRYPEGIWLAETAVDTETLEVLAAHGIQYTVLAPRQAKGIRKLGAASFDSVNENTLDTRRPYWCNLPSGRRIALYFYNGDIAKDVAFNGLLNSGPGFAKRLKSAFSKNDQPELVHIATDGESYGHHHRHGEMALSHCIWTIEEGAEIKFTNYGQFLELFPPEYEAQIWENSSWSCVHGVERWRANCGCNSGSNPGWTQTWRAPLREALDKLRDTLIPAYQTEAARFLRDPWAARNDYIRVINDRSEAVRRDFLKKHTKRTLSEKEEVQVFRLLEMQKHCLYMYTSCGWFFDEISGIETTQILQYALRAIEYAEDTLGKNLKSDFLVQLAKAPSNVFANGAEAFQKNVEPARVNLKRVAMHFAAESVFTQQPPSKDLFNYSIKTERFRAQVAGSFTFVTGTLMIHSNVTHAERRYSFAVLHLGAQQIIGNLSSTLMNEDFDKMLLASSTAFDSGRLGDVLGVMQEFFGGDKFTISSLFKEEQTKIITEIAEKSLSSAVQNIRESYRESYPLMIALKEANLPIPEGFTNMANFVLKQSIREFFDSDNNDLASLQRMVDDLTRWGLQLKDEPAIKRAAEKRIYRKISKLHLEGSNLDETKQLIDLVEKTMSLGLDLALWKIQNHFYNLTRGYRKGHWVFVTKQWELAIRRLGELLSVRLP